ncbi:GNAT family N-acetyltransferase [Paraburkholderia sp. J12]|uniref:GNAT family N-acetyltransferase n=1 Tax=Paraburkholderia sp. J12 TaxID=2805432 RepID=UPI002ABD2F5E|nr:GNAT family N-acetyltransferase [Paraburkholderia sp. J12]
MLTIRKANRDDGVDAWEIRRTSVLAACAGHYPESALAQWVEGTVTEKWTSVVERDFYVAVDDGLVVGTGMLTVESGQVDAIFVRPSHMGRGVGGKMLRFLEALAARHGVVEMRLDATLNAAPFYRSLGWVGDAVSIYRTARGVKLACVPMTKRVPPGFVVLYRWRLHAGSEDAFIQGWTRLSDQLRSRGSLGARLHRGSDGIWYSYAQWPSAQVRADALSMGNLDEAAKKKMRAAIAESYPEIILEPVSDSLGSPGTPDAHSRSRDVCR